MPIWERSMRNSSQMCEMLSMILDHNSTFALRPHPELVLNSPRWMEAGVILPYNSCKY